MTAGVYARKSTDQTGVADEAKSVARQVEHARAFAERKGWTVADEHVYVDDGISGAEFANRPGYMRLLNALGRRAPFDVLIVSELSRLGREQLETGYAVKQLSRAGVRIWSYLEDREIVLDSPTDKFLLSAVNFAAEIEREKARQRVADVMARKARAGHVCGGAIFGYRNVPVLGPDGRRSHVERQVDPEQAAIVRRIFDLCAGGKGLKRITKLLNAEDVPAPRAQRGRPRAWAPSSVRGVLYHDLYRGVQIYNKTRQSDAWGQHANLRRPKADWIETRVEHLRIVSDKQWAAAHQRLDAAMAVYARSTNGQMWGRPPAGVESKHLQSGFGQCALCGAAMTVRSRSHGRRRFYTLVCASYDHRGPTVCQNGLALPMAEADDAVLSAVADYVLDPAVVEGAITEALAQLRPDPTAAGARRVALEADRRRLDEEQERLVAAIAVAGEVEALAAALARGERERQRVLAELAALDGAAQLSTFDVKRVERDLRGRLMEWRGLLRRQTPIARQILGRLLDGRIAWTPHQAEGRYTFAGRVKFDRLLAGIVLPQGVSSPTGFEPVFWP